MQSLYFINGDLEKVKEILNLIRNICNTSDKNLKLPAFQIFLMAWGISAVMAKLNLNQPDLLSHSKGKHAVH